MESSNDHLVKLEGGYMAIYCKTAGKADGKIIVFIHGGGISGWMWDKQLEHFKDYCCLVPDLPEHGKSLKEGQISIKGSACLVADLIEKRAAGEKVHVVGHSLGAKIVLELLKTRPEIIDRAVVASALCRNISLLKWVHKRAIYKCTVAMLKSDWLLDFQVKQFKVWDESSKQSLRKDFRAITPEAMYRTYDEVYRNIELPIGLDKMDVPTLALAGEREATAMKQSVRDIMSVIPHSKGALIKNGSHTFPWVMHDDFNETIRAWIEDREVNRDNLIHL